MKCTYEIIKASEENKIKNTPLARFKMKNMEIRQHQESKGNKLNAKGFSSRLQYYQDFSTTPVIERKHALLHFCETGDFPLH